jgi:hypothetical protein
MTVNSMLKTRMMEEKDYMTVNSMLKTRMMEEKDYMTVNSRIMLTFKYSNTLLISYT